MTKEEIRIYARQITYTGQTTVLTFKDKSQWFGFFDRDNNSPADFDNNEWNFVHFNKDNISKKNEKFKGNDLVSIEIN